MVDYANPTIKRTTDDRVKKPTSQKVQQNSQKGYMLNRIIKISEKLDKYLDLARVVKNYGIQKVTMILIVIEAFRMIQKKLRTLEKK